MIQKPVAILPLLRAVSCKFSAYVDIDIDIDILFMFHESTITINKIGYVWNCYFTVCPDTSSHHHNKQFFIGCVFSKRHSTLRPWTSLESLSYACIGFKNNSVWYEIEIHTCIVLSDVIF